MYVTGSLTVGKKKGQKGYEIKLSGVKLSTNDLEPGKYEFVGELTASGTIDLKLEKV